MHQKIKMNINDIN